MDPQQLGRDIPDPGESRRASSGRIVRVIYASGVIAIVIALAWHYGRSLIFLEGAGTITAKRYALSAPYTVQVLNIKVVPGSRVKAGDVIAEVKSFQVDQYLSDLLRAISDQTNKQADLQIRLAIARSTLSPSKKRLEIANNTVSRFGLGAEGVSTLQYRTEVYREHSNAVIAFAQAEAESTEITAQLALLTDNRLALEARITRINAEFDGGKIITPIDGVIGGRISQSGGTIPVGEVVAEVYNTNELYVDWEIPLRRLIEPRVGDPVYITAGYSVIEGKITDIFPISTSLGANRNEGSSYAHRGQTARVKNHGFDTLLAVDSQVTVFMNYSRLTNWLVDLFRPSFRQ
jgi:multidrug resistance efflux pump